MKDEGRTERIVVMMTPEEVGGVDAWMFARQIRRGRSEAIRQLVRAGIEATTPPTAPAEAPEPEPPKKPRRR